MANYASFRSISAWKSSIALFLQTCFYMGTIKSIGVFLPELEVGLGLTSTDIGLALGFFGAFAFGPGPVVAFLYRRLPVGYRRVLVMMGALLAPGGLILGSLVTNNAQLATCLSAAGLGSNILTISQVIALSDQSGDAFRIFYGIGKSGYAFGMTLVPLLAEYLMRVYGWRGSLKIIGGIMTHLIPLTMVVDVNAGDVVQDAPGLRKSGVGNLDGPLNATDEESSGADTRLLEDNMSVLHWDGAETDSSCSQSTLECGGSSSSNGKDNGLLDAIYEETIAEDTIFTERPSRSDMNKPPTKVADVSSNGRKIFRQTNLSGFLDTVCCFLQESIFNRDRWLIILMLTIFVSAMVNSGWYAFLIPRAVARGIPITTALSLAYSAATAAFLARCFSGLLLNYKPFSGQRCFLFMTLMNIASLLADIFVPKFALMIVTSFISSLSSSYRNILILVICKDRGSLSEFPLIFASGEIVYGLGMFLGGSLSGFMADTYGSFDASFMFIAAADTLVFCLMIPPTIVEIRKQ